MREVTSPLRSNLSDLHEIDWLTVERVEINCYPFHRFPRLPYPMRVRTLLECATERVGGILRQCVEHQSSSIVQHGERVMVAFARTWDQPHSITKVRERRGQILLLGVAYLGMAELARLSELLNAFASRILHGETVQPSDARVESAAVNERISAGYPRTYDPAHTCSLFLADTSRTM
jgi:hypothetical protein